MAGRGRGRGRGASLTFSVEVLGFGRGDALPASAEVPPPCFPALQTKPVPLLLGEEQDYILALKREFRTNMKDSKFFCNTEKKTKDVQHYSDRYRHVLHNQGIYRYEWSRFPKELKIYTSKKKMQVKKKPNVKAALNRNVQDVTKKLDELEAKERSESEDEEKEVEEKTEKPEGAGDAEDEEEILEEEDMEEGTDYAVDYFENGENYLDEEDDNLGDEATY